MRLGAAEMMSATSPDRMYASTEGLAQGRTSISPTPITGRDRRSTSMRRSQCRNEPWLRSCASTFTALNP